MKTFSEQFEDFCRNSVDMEYDFRDGNVCACAQFAHFIGATDYRSQALPFIVDGRGRVLVTTTDFGPRWEDYEILACQPPWTFSALADRIRDNRDNIGYIRSPTLHTEANMDELCNI